MPKKYYDSYRAATEKMYIKERMYTPQEFIYLFEAPLALIVCVCVLVFQA